MKLPLPALIVCILGALFVPASQAQRHEASLSGPGWKLWLDKDAKWEKDELFLPPVDLAKLPVNPPTGGWDALQAAQAVSVPGTVEEYLSAGNGPTNDIKGVSWWVRKIKVPQDKGAHRIRLQFDAVRMRAEIFVNHKLVGYDVIGNTPFEVDITDAVKPGEDIELAVRVTDPGGNFDWRDSSSFHWGEYSIPMSHGFGGIFGDVRLIVCDPVYVDDVYVQNQPSITNVLVLTTIKNTTTNSVSREVACDVVGGTKFGKSPPHGSKLTVNLPPGETVVTQAMSVAGAKLWSVEDPNLYVCRVRVSSDEVQKAFGFRWFAPEGIGSNAVFRLNGKRIVLRTAISWGFWPINGLFPTDELAAKQVRTAKLLGQNMLTFHRCIGAPNVLDQADEQGLLYYEEPGGYKSADSDFGDALAREKLLRLVKRDRSHPALVIYSMINERSQAQRLQPRERADMQSAHELDPSRTITLSSSWATRVNQPQDIKAHMRPYDSELHLVGWYDNHHAGGPEVWRQNLYRSPSTYYNRTTNYTEISFWGEEGAISTPPRLQEIVAALKASPVKGWDGQMYLDWYKRMDEFLTRKNLRKAFPDVQAFTTGLGSVSLYHQGRKIETMRMGDVADGYAVNGWEAESVENHSGIVDCWRNPKGDPAIMAYYNQPLYIAVKSRSQFAQIPGEVTVDFYAINEKNIHGPHTLKIVVESPQKGVAVFTKEMPVSLTGGEVYGELLASDVKLPITGAIGKFRIEAILLDAAHKEVTTGHDEVLAVDWRSTDVKGKGAVWEGQPNVKKFLEKEKGLAAETYRDDLGKLDWVVVTRPVDEAEPVEVPAEQLQSLTATFSTDNEFGDKLYQRNDRTIEFSVTDGAAPDPQVNVLDNYGVRWDGTILPPVTGDYTFVIQSGEGVRLWVNGESLVDDYYTRENTVNRGRVHLEAGKHVKVRLDFWHRRGNAECKLLWAPPEIGAPGPQKLIDRVRNDGTTLIVLDRADTWMRLITNNTAATYGGSFQIGTAWLGGLHFVREHPLFAGLPVNCAMDWPYQAVVRNGKTRSGMLLEGEELVAGAWHCYPMNLGTAVGIIPCGKGRIIVTTLDIASQLGSADTSAEVARKLFCNFVAYATSMR